MLTLSILTMTSLAAVTTAEADTMPVKSLEELNVVAIKQEERLRDVAVSATVIGLEESERLGITDMKGFSNVVPNFFIPDYGSRITSSIYVRGIGARMDQPAVGLNVDNVPYLNKDSYDFDVADISSIEMLRGPQSTLYGRNTMGGLINITTLSPMLWQGVRGMVEAGNGTTIKAAAGWYARFGDNFATSVNANYTHRGGFFTNRYNNRKLDKENGGSARWKTQWRITPSLYLQNVLSSSLLRQGGYPYEYIDTGEINYNDTCFYRRFTINDGLTLRYRGERVSVTSVTAVQHINDNMTLDQDFLPLPYFTLTQKQKETGLTEDVVARGDVAGGKYGWLAGLFGFYKHLDMSAPVTFKDKGISSLIEDHRNQANGAYPIKWDTREFPLLSDFTIPTYGVALYHESKFNAGQWHFTAGIRLDYEHASLDYLSRCDTGYEIYQRDGNGGWEKSRHVDININDSGTLSREYLNWMPKLSVLYQFDGNGAAVNAGNVYAVVSKGYKAGGFNTQMFSEVLQGRLMNIMGLAAGHSVDEIVGYKPEYSWNYEAGSHLAFFDNRLDIDLSLFYISCRDQQMTTFPDGTTTGRIMTNAGKTRSLGGELAIRYTPTDAFSVNASYGYTNARFVDYNDGKEQYKGNYIPYAPQNTIFLQALYTFPLHRNVLDIRRITLDANLRATGKIYWNEQNTLSQPLYAELGANVELEAGKWSLQLWGANLTNTKFHTFYFMSMGNEFVQRGKPLRFGATLRFSLPTQ